MKKIYLLLFMLSAVFAFSACSDDNDDATPSCPVNGYSVPATAKAGTSLTIPGTGYTEGAKIILKNAQNQETQAENTQIGDGGITVTLPASLAAGNYKVILRQSGDWELGTITLEAAGPIEGLSIPATATAGDNITIGGKGFDENTSIYLENDELTIDELIVSNVTATGLNLQIPAILAGGSYRVMLAQGDGIRLGNITIIAKTEPCVISSIVKISNYENDSLLFHYTAGKLSSIVSKTYEEWTYNIEYPSTTSMKLSYTPAYGFPISYEYTLSNGRVITELMKTQETLYDDQGMETGTIDKTFENTYSYTAENYLQQISQKPDDNGYDTLYFNYNGGQLQELIISQSSPVMEPDPEFPNEEVTSTSVTSTKAIDTYLTEYTFSYAQQIENLAAFDVMSVILNQIDGSEKEYLVRLLGIGGKYPTQLPTSYTAWGDEQEIKYTVINGYVTKIVFPNEEYPEESITFRFAYQ